MPSEVLHAWRNHWAYNLAIQHGRFPAAARECIRAVRRVRSTNDQDDEQVWLGRLRWSLHYRHARGGAT